jgi:hypothetical protein
MRWEYQDGVLNARHQTLKGQQIRRAVLVYPKVKQIDTLNIRDYYFYHSVDET